MAITISTHNGHQVSLAHNNREKWMVDRENAKWAEKHPGELRIDLTKEHEIWKSEDLQTAYEKLFGDAVREYNIRMEARKTPERKIKNYLSEIRAKENQSKNAKHPIYEIIYAVGSRDNPVEDSIAKQILYEVAMSFQERNPHLYVVNIAYHADEVGVIHCHVSYIPYATNQTRGLHTQNALTAALKQQGIVSQSYTQTAQILWERQENDTLEKICNKYGFEVVHPQRGTKQEHLSIEEYKLQRTIDDKQEHLEELQNLPMGVVAVKKGRLEQLEAKEKIYVENIGKIEQAERDLKAARESMSAYAKAANQLYKDQKKFDEKVNEAANRKLDLLKDKAVTFIKQMGLWQSFKSWCESFAAHNTSKRK